MHRTMHHIRGEYDMQKQRKQSAVTQAQASVANYELIYFLVSLSLFVILALLISDSTLLIR